MRAAPGRPARTCRHHGGGSSGEQQKPRGGGKALPFGGETSERGHPAPRRGASPAGRGAGSPHPGPGRAPLLCLPPPAAARRAGPDRAEPGGAGGPRSALPPRARVGCPQGWARGGSRRGITWAVDAFPLAAALALGAGQGMRGAAGGQRGEGEHQEGRGVAERQRGSRPQQRPGGGRALSQHGEGRPRSSGMAAAGPQHQPEPAAPPGRDPPFSAAPERTFSIPAAAAARNRCCRRRRRRRGAGRAVPAAAALRTRPSARRSCRLAPAALLCARRPAAPPLRLQQRERSREAATAAAAAAAAEGEEEKGEREREMGEEAHVIAAPSPGTGGEVRGFSALGGQGERRRQRPPSRRGRPRGSGAGSRAGTGDRRAGTAPVGERGREGPQGRRGRRTAGTALVTVRVIFCYSLISRREWGWERKQRDRLFY